KDEGAGDVAAVFNDALAVFVPELLKHGKALRKPAPEPPQRPFLGISSRHSLRQIKTPFWRNLLSSQDYSRQLVVSTQTQVAPKLWVSWDAGREPCPSWAALWWRNSNIQRHCDETSQSLGNHRAFLS